jgi:dienelactone hydrolase
MQIRVLLLIVITLASDSVPALADLSWSDAGRFEISVPIGGEPNLSAVRGVLSRPQGNGPFAAVVMFPGISGFNIHLRDLTRHADHYSSMGLVMLALDPAGSRGYPPGSSTPAAALRKDAYAALNYLRSIAVVGSQKIFVEGISRGGGVVLAARQQPEFGPATTVCRGHRLRSVVLSDPDPLRTTRHILGWR